MLRLAEGLFIDLRPGAILATPLDFERSQQPNSNAFTTHSALLDQITRNLRKEVLNRLSYTYQWILKTMKGLYVKGTFYSEQQPASRQSKRGRAPARADCAGACSRFGCARRSGQWHGQARFYQSQDGSHRRPSATARPVD